MRVSIRVRRLFASLNSIIRSVRRNKTRYACTRKQKTVAERVCLSTRVISLVISTRAQASSFEILRARTVT